MRFLKITFLLGLILTFQNSFAQKGQGYLINLKNDTISGELSFSKDFKTAHVIHQGKELSFSGDELKSVHFFNGITYSPFKITKNEPFFCEKIYEGKLSLIVHKKTFYLLSADGTISELRRPVKSTDSFVSSNTSDNIFRETLKAHLSDCKKITNSQLLKVNYDEASLIKLLNGYHLCINEKGTNLKKGTKKTSIIIGPLVGLGSSKIKFIIGQNFVDEVEWRNEIYKSIGFFFQTKPILTKNPVGFSTEVLYNHVKRKGSFVSNAQGLDQINTYNFERSSISINPQLNYHLIHNKNFKLSILAGPSLDLPLVVKTLRTFQFRGSEFSDYTTEKFENFMNSEKTYIGFDLSAEFQRKLSEKFSLKFGPRISALTASPELKFNNSLYRSEYREFNFQILVGILFQNKKTAYQ